VVAVEGERGGHLGEAERPGGRDRVHIEASPGLYLDEGPRGPNGAAVAAPKGHVPIMGSIVMGYLLLALILWGIVKCAALSAEPLVNAKCARGLAFVLAGWGIVLVATIGRLSVDGPPSNEGMVASLVATLTSCLLSLAGVLVAVLGMREISRKTVDDGELAFTRGRGMAIGACVLSALMILPGVLLATFSARGAAGGTTHVQSRRAH